MAVNIDEGEPGTFRTATILERNPHQFLEGMLIAPGPSALVIYIYLRDEYHGCRELLTRTGGVAHQSADCKHAGH